MKPSYITERNYFTATNLFVSLMCLAGAVSAKESLAASPTMESLIAIYVYMTGAVGVLGCMSLSLMLKKPTETMRLVTGRFTMSLLLTVLGTRISLELTNNWPTTDILLIGGYALVVCVFAYTIGHAIIHHMSRKSEHYAQLIADRVLKGDSK